MALPYAANGATVSIASLAVVTEPVNAAAYAALSWTAIGFVNNIGDYDDEAAIAEATTMQENRKFKAKTIFDAGMVPLMVLDVPNDAGQVLLKTAVASALPYPIKIQLPQPITVGGAGEINYFVAHVASKKIQPQDGTQITKRVFNLALTTKVTVTAAT